jgi:carbon monoxide dehydrogenase subunit G
LTLIATIFQLGKDRRAELAGTQPNPSEQQKGFRVDRPKRNGFIVPAFLWLICLSAHAQEDSKPLVGVKQVDSVIEVSASIAIPVKPCVVYAVLTDYDKLPAYIPGILESHAERVSHNRVRVRQAGSVKVLFFNVRMDTLQEIEEVPKEKLVFKQIEGDLKSYHGEWDLSETQDGTRLDYSAALTFKQFVPMFIAKATLERQMLKQFPAIAREAISSKDRRSLDCGMNR